MTLVENNDRCCSCNFPDIPANWLLFADFAFMFATTVVYFADIVTDIITLRKFSVIVFLIYSRIHLVGLPVIIFI